MLTLEKALWQEGRQYVVGVDEVGRGAWAGPVVVGAVMFSPTISSTTLAGINDSKLLSDKQRRSLVPVIQEQAQACAYGEASVAEIETVGLSKALSLALHRALEQITPIPDFILADANLIKISLQRDLFYSQSLVESVPYTSHIRGDSRSISIAAASIVAKVYRDTLMTTYAETYPEYGFDEHKGYGTKQHQLALEKHGCCKLHRKSFAPIREIIKNGQKEMNVKSRE